jgi:hypothetical protein
MILSLVPSQASQPNLQLSTFNLQQLAPDILVAAPLPYEHRAPTIK